MTRCPYRPNGRLIHGKAHTSLAHIADSSVDVIFADPPYGIQKAVSSLPRYDKSASIIAQKWTDFSALWDVIDDYWTFTREWLFAARRVMSPTASLWITGTFHNIPIIQLVLKELNYHVVQWVSWCKPNAFPNREVQQQVSANEVVIHARLGSRPLHIYNAERAKGYMALDYVRRTGTWPENLTNLRDFWPINNDSRAVKTFPFLKGHGAKKPPELVARCIDLTLPESGGVVLDPFFGTGTTGYVCQYINDWILEGRAVLPEWIGIELYEEYVTMCELRLQCSRDSSVNQDGMVLPVKEQSKLHAALGKWGDWIVDNRPSDEMNEAYYRICENIDMGIRDRIKVPK